MVFATEMPLMSLVLYSQTHGCWKLTDFGSASQATSKRLNTTCFLRGTDSYRSPEVLEHGRFNNRADLFALGCIIFEIVTGRKRFSSDWAVLQYSQNENLRSSELWPRSPGQSHLHRLGRLTSFLLAADPKARPGAVETSRLLLDIHRGRDPVRESNGSASELDIFLEDAEKSDVSTTEQLQVQSAFRLHRQSFNFNTVGSVTRTFQDPFAQPIKGPSDNHLVDNGWITPQIMHTREILDSIEWNI